MWANILQDMSAMMYNPNNVATEASPLTTELEKQVGEDLCTMLGYHRSEEDSAPWGHITCESPGTTSAPSSLKPTKLTCTRRCEGWVGGQPRGHLG